MFGGSRQVGRPAAGVPCKACKRLILWRRTTEGKWMPVEAERWEGWLLAQGAGPVVTVLDDLGRILRGHQLVNEDAAAEVHPRRARGWLPHWPTCSGADAFRKRPRAEQASWLSDRPEPPGAA
jgi:hypothetical protein